MCVKIVCRWSKLLYSSKLKQVKIEPGNGDEVDRERIANGTWIWNLKIWMCSPNSPQEFPSSSVSTWVYVKRLKSLCHLFLSGVHAIFKTLQDLCAESCYILQLPTWPTKCVTIDGSMRSGHFEWRFFDFLSLNMGKHGAIALNLSLLYLYVDLYFYMAVIYIIYLYLPLSAFSHCIYLCPETCWLE